MKYLNNTKRTRFKVSVYFGTVLAILTAYSVFKEMNDVAIILGGSVAGLVAKYSHDETKRKSITNA